MHTFATSLEWNSCTAYAVSICWNAIFSKPWFDKFAGGKLWEYCIDITGGQVREWLDGNEVHARVDFSLGVPPVLRSWVLYHRKTVR